MRKKPLLLIISFLILFVPKAQEVKLGTPDGHNSNVIFNALSNDEKLIITSGEETVKLWDVPTGKLLYSFDSSNFATFRPNQKEIIIAKRDSSLELRDLITSQVKIRLNFDFPLKSIICSDDGNHLVVSSDHASTYLIDLTKQKIKLIKHYSSSNYKNKVDIKQNLFISHGEKGITVYDVKSRKKLLSLRDEDNLVMNGFNILPNSQVLFIFKNGTYRIYDIKTGKILKELFTYETRGYISSIQYSESGEFIIVDFGSTSKLFYNGNNKIEEIISGNYIAMNSEGNRIISTDSLDERTEKLKVWQANGKNLSMTGSTSINYLHEATLSSNGNLLAIANNRKPAISLLDLEELSFIAEINKEGFHKPRPTFLSKNTKLIASCSVVGWTADNGLLLFDLNSRQLITDFKSRQNSHVQINRYFFRDNILFFGSTDHNYYSWSIKNGKINYALHHLGRINALTFSSDSSFMVTASEDKTAKVWNLDGDLISTLSGSLNGIDEAIISPKNNLVATLSYNNKVELWNPLTGELKHALRLGSKWEEVKAEFSRDGNYIKAYNSKYTTAKLWRLSGRYPILVNDELPIESSINQDLENIGLLKEDSSNISEDNLFFEVVSSNNIDRLINKSTGQELYSPNFGDSLEFRHLILKDSILIIHERHWVPDSVENNNSQGFHKFLHVNDLLKVINHSTNNTLLDSSFSKLKNIQLIANNKFLTFEIDSKWSDTLPFNDIKVFNLSGSQFLNLRKKSPDDPIFRVIFNSIGSIVAYNTEYGLLFLNLVDNSIMYYKEWGISNITFLDDRGIMVIQGGDAANRICEVETGQTIISHFYVDKDPEKWLHLHPDGYFDASPEAMELMYWTKGLEVIEFTQLKDRCWVPGLWEKVMNGEEFEGSCVGTLDLQPEIEVDSVDGKGQVPIHLKKREGGYGDIAIFINGKEVARDIRGEAFDTTLTEQTLRYSIENHPYLVDGENTITVQTKSANGFVQGRGASLVYNHQEKEQEPVSFYGLVIGIGDYLNDQMNLSFTEKDAEAISISVEQGAANLFGEERTHIYTLTTDNQNTVSKKEIKEAVKEIAEKAQAQDILMIYLSGHGITWGSDDINGDFYFLTSNATTTSKEAFSDPYLRSTTTISTSEWVDLINSIPANKQVMIIDACGSGKAVDNLIAARNIEASQIKAIDRMKDRTGMFIISGSAADAVSYEASQYGQGLLTYSILQGMKGAALKEDQYVDVITILSFAKDQVPQLAKGIGGIQEPQLLIPKGGSFDIGIIDSEARELIPLASPKRVFVRSSLINLESLEDNLDFTALLNKELATLTTKGGDMNLIFFDASEYPNACKISGGYTESSDGILLQLKVRCGEDLKSFEVEGKNGVEVIERVLVVINEEL